MNQHLGKGFDKLGDLLVVNREQCFVVFVAVLVVPGPVEVDDAGFSSRLERVVLA